MRIYIPALIQHMFLVVKWQPRSVKVAVSGHMLLSMSEYSYMHYKPGCRAQALGELVVGHPQRVKRLAEAPGPGLEDVGVAQLLGHDADAGSCLVVVVVVFAAATSEPADVDARPHKGLDQGLVVDAVAGHDGVEAACVGRPRQRQRRRRRDLVLLPVQGRKAQPVRRGRRRAGTCGGVGVVAAGWVSAAPGGAAALCRSLAMAGGP